MQNSVLLNVWVFLAISPEQFILCGLLGIGTIYG